MSDRLAPASYGVRVDILSDTLAALRTGRPGAVRTQARAPWGLRFRPIAGAGFHVVVEGQCLLVPPSDDDPVRLGPGDVVFLRSGSGHTLCDDVESAPVEFVPERVDTTSPIGSIDVPGSGATTVLLCGAYQLDVERPHPFLTELPDLIHLPAGPGRHPALRAAIDQLCAEVREPRQGSDSVVATLIDLLLLYILRSWYDDQPQARTPGWAGALSDPLLAPALMAMHEDPAQPWTIESLGSRAGLSRAAFARRFTEVVGEPPLSYLTTWRMTVAARLLRESEEPLRSVAGRVGYTSEFAFAKAFKRHYGSAPGSYRKTFRV